MARRVHGRIGDPIHAASNCVDNASTRPTKPASKVTTAAPAPTTRPSPRHCSAPTRRQVGAEPGATCPARRSQRGRGNHRVRPRVHRLEGCTSGRWDHRLRRTCRQCGRGRPHVSAGDATPWEVVLMLVIDAANVIGSRSDGWWRDRAAAAQRFAEWVRATVAAGTFSGLGAVRRDTAVTQFVENHSETVRIRVAPDTRASVKTADRSAEDCSSTRRRSSRWRRVHARSSHWRPHSRSPTSCCQPVPAPR